MWGDRFMAYTVNLSSNQQLTIVNQGTQTLITLVSSSPGQQQSQSSSFTTGSWTTAPELYRTGTGFILQINSARGQQFVLIQANNINAIAAPLLDNAVKLDLENTPNTAASQQGDSISGGNTSRRQNNLEFEPMQPMQPMKMGNMSMDIRDLQENNHPAFTQ